jgi:hypothetical protein
MGLPLLHINNLGTPLSIGNLPTMSAIVKEIDNCRPIAMSINWLSGPAKDEGHGLAIIGYKKDPSGDQLIIWDPGKSFPGDPPPPYVGGQKTVLYATFSSKYNEQTISIDDCIGTKRQP